MEGTGGETADGSSETEARPGSRRTLRDGPPPEQGSQDAESHRDPVHRFFDLLGETDPKAAAARDAAAAESLRNAIVDHQVAENYNVLVLFDEGPLIRSDADRLYSAIRKLEEDRDVLLVLFSAGGEVEPAYLISQLCRESALQRFVVGVPRRAKSAATLICCGADEVHMGPMSELGPIDPQIGDHPALGLGNALRHIAAIVGEHPKAASMFAQYMSLTVRPIDLGYYERVVESAAQYAERLLSSRSVQLDDPGAIARTLVYEYKDHGFVIDRAEARRILGDEMVRADSPEYHLANAIYEHLGFLKFLASVKGFGMYWVGSLDTGCQVLQPPED